jgi:hypothetical protein
LGGNGRRSRVRDGVGIEIRREGENEKRAKVRYCKLECLIRVRDRKKIRVIESEEDERQEEF